MTLSSDETVENGNNIPQVPMQFYVGTIPCKKHFVLQQITLLFYKFCFTQKIKQQHCTGLLTGIIRFLIYTPIFLPLHVKSIKIVYAQIIYYTIFIAQIILYIFSANFFKKYKRNLEWRKSFPITIFWWSDVFTLLLEKKLYFFIQRKNVKNALYN